MCVVVKFCKRVDGNEMEEAWALDGIEGPGLYPIVPRTGTWHLDKARRSPRLETSRTHVPLAPAFAMPSHAAQGQTLTGGAIVDVFAPGRIRWART